MTQPTQTDPQNPAGTEGEPGSQTPAATPAATPPQGGGSATPGDVQVPEGYQLVKTEDATNVVSQRDQANQRLSDLEKWAAPIAIRNTITDFLTEHKKDYPDIEVDDLMHVDSPEMMESEAKRLQGRFAAHAQKKIMEIENPQLPTQTIEERRQNEARLKKDMPKDAFEQMVTGRMRPVTQ